MSDIQTITLDLLRRANLMESQVDVSALSGAITGAVLSERSDIRAVLEQIQAFVQFDSVESGGVLALRPRGQASIASIDLLELVGDSRHASLTITRVQDLSLPEQLNLLFADKNRDYQRGSETALRQIAPPTTQKTVPTNFVLSSDVAKRQADMLMDAAWSERFQFRFSLPLQYLYLEPGDVITLHTPARDWVMRLLRTTYDDGAIKVEAVSSDAAAYQQTSQGSTGGTLQEIVIAGGTILYLLDLPLPTETEQPAFFMAVGRARDDRKWQYATLYESLDTINFTAKQLLTREAVHGETLTVLGGNAPTAYWDDAHSVDVLLRDGEVESQSDALLLQGSNSAVLGDEIIQFGSATLIASNTYRLSHLLRGRRGTEWAMGVHNVSERFLLLGSEVYTVGITANMVGSSRAYKAVSNGKSLEDTSAQTFTHNAINLKPLAAVHVAGVRNTAGDLTITWIRRSRTSSGWQDGVDMPLFEASEAYDIEILNGTDVVRTASVNSPLLVYTAAEQTADFGSPQSSVSVRIYQRSEAVGRGFRIQKSL